MGLGKTQEDRAALLKRVGVLDVCTISTGTPPDWTDGEVEETGRFLEEHGIRVGEFSGFHTHLGSADRRKHREAVEHYVRQLGHASILGAHCVGFSLVCDRVSAEMWSDETWARCIDAVTELVSAAEAAGMDVAAHPHIMGPLHSVERYQALLDAVDSPRLKVLLDPVNLVWPHLFFRTTELINEALDALGDRIAAVHAKDVTMSCLDRDGPFLSVVHLDEAVPGTGGMDYETLLRRLDELGCDVTIHVEHFSPENTVVGQQYIRYTARRVGVQLH
jgi:sugar phosphate isomerase/epimerase